jgi:gluconate 2-dehydrogenase alpha chain
VDELDHAYRFRMMQNLAEETMTHRHSAGVSAVPIRQYGSFHPGTGVGGAGEHWGAISYRFYPENFKLGAFLRDKYGSRLPQNLAVQDWGVSYEEIENVSDLSVVMQVSEPCLLADVVYQCLRFSRGGAATAKATWRSG